MDPEIAKQFQNIKGQLGLRGSDILRRKTKLITLWLFIIDIAEKGEVES
jgi:hypothetical protein